jgi:hypothetical protein
MTDNNAQLGPAITNAIRFLRRIYQDIGELLAALDGVMAERGWRPTEATRVSWILSNGSDPTRWLLDNLFRFYFQGETLKSFQGLLAFVLWLDNLPAPFDQPMMLGAAARFASPTSQTAIVQQWKDSGKVFEALGAIPGPRLLSAAEVNTFLPTASHVFGTAVPLCSLSGTESLLTQFIDPLLKAQPTLGR